MDTHIRSCATPRVAPVVEQRRAYRVRERRGSYPGIDIVLPAVLQRRIHLDTVRGTGYTDKVVVDRGFAARSGRWCAGSAGSEPWPPGGPATACSCPSATGCQLSMNEILVTTGDYGMYWVCIRDRCGVGRYRHHRWIRRGGRLCARSAPDGRIVLTDGREIRPVQISMPGPTEDRGVGWSPDRRSGPPLCSLGGRSTTGRPVGWFIRGPRTPSCRIGGASGSTLCGVDSAGAKSTGAECAILRSTAHRRGSRRIPAL